MLTELIVLRGGRVLDPSQGLDDTADLVIEAGRINKNIFFDLILKLAVHGYLPSLGHRGQHLLGPRIQRERRHDGDASCSDQVAFAKFGRG